MTSIEDKIRLSSERRLRGVVVIPGTVTGKLMVSREPLSFWGGYDIESGEIIDRKHQLSGKIAHGSILAIPGTKGSSTTTAVLLEALIKGTAPLAILTRGVDSFLALALVVADEMYSKSIPLIALGSEEFSSLESGLNARLEEDGTILLEPLR